MGCAERLDCSAPFGARLVCTWSCAIALRGGGAERAGVSMWANIKVLEFFVVSVCVLPKMNARGPVDFDIICLFCARLNLLGSMEGLGNRRVRTAMVLVASSPLQIPLAIPWYVVKLEYT